MDVFSWLEGFVEMYCLVVCFFNRFFEEVECEIKAFFMLMFNVVFLVKLFGLYNFNTEISLLKHKSIIVPITYGQNTVSVAIE